MSDSIGMYRNPYNHQYVAPQGYAFIIMGLTKEGLYGLQVQKVII